MTNTAIGRPSKGARKALLTRLAVPIAEAVERTAAEAGYASVSDYIATVLAREVGLPELAPAQPSSALPLGML
jgi:hypothetical protein